MDLLSGEIKINAAVFQQHLSQIYDNKILLIRCAERI